MRRGSSGVQDGRVRRRCVESRVVLSFSCIPAFQGSVQPDEEAGLSDLKSENQNPYEGDIVVDKLSPAERELVALGAALGSNCVPCIEYHVPEARKTGLSDAQINEAIHLADKVRQVPARKVLVAALGMLPDAGAKTNVEQSGDACGARPPQDRKSEQPCCAA